MVKASEIKDEKTLNAWLEVRTREAVMEVAVRGILRVLPGYLFLTLKNPELGLSSIEILLDTLRLKVACDLGVLRTHAKDFFPKRLETTRTDRLLEARRAVEGELQQLGRMPNRDSVEESIGFQQDLLGKINAAFVFVESVNAALSVAVDGKMDRAVKAVACNVRSSAPGNPFLESVKKDAMRIEAGETLFSTPLWPIENPLRSEWDAVRVQPSWTGPDAPYAFWRRWYQGVLDGVQVFPKQILYDLSILSEDFWNSDNAPQKVASLIEDLEAGDRRLIRRAKQLETQLDLERTRAENLELDLDRQVELLKDLSRQLEETSEQFAAQKDDAARTLGRLEEEYKSNFEAAILTYKEEQNTKAPVVLWDGKSADHNKNATKFFRIYLVFLAALFGALGFGLWEVGQSSWLGDLLSAPACPEGETCSVFSLKGGFVAGAVLTMLTIALWVARLLMKIYLSERHLALDALERKAFTETYLGLLREGDASEEMQEHRGIVYSAIFRPTSDGMIKDEGGLDPSISAAVSKFLSKN